MAYVDSLTPHLFVPTAQRPVRAKARQLRADTQVMPHSHPWAQVAISTTGVIRLTVDRGTYIVPPSRALWIPPGVEHAVTMVEDADLPWGMVFAHSGSLQPRHPSQIYQFLLEGMLLFVLLWLYARRERPQGQVAAAFLVGYGVLRFIAEYFREPDSFLGLLSLGMSMGQWLCLPMVLAGAGMWLYCGRSAAR